MMRDFLGQPFTVGCYVASGAGGNGPAEYGMLLHRVVSLSPLRLTRLTVKYNPSGVVASSRTFVVQVPTKYVIVQPPQEVADLFEATIAGTLTPLEHIQVGTWIHGAKQAF